MRKKTDGRNTQPEGREHLQGGEKESEWVAPKVAGDPKITTLQGNTQSITKDAW